MPNRPLSRLHRLALGRFPGRLIRAAATPPLASTRACLTAHPQRRVEVYTFVTDEREYAAMIDSFGAAGLDAHASFHRLCGHDAEPYAELTRLGSSGGAPYAVLCHEDIRIGTGVTAECFFGRLAELERRDPAWVVAGPAGVASNLEIVRRVTDQWGGHSPHLLPLTATSLDELCLILNRRNRPRCTPGLHGFHFYGTDVCLNAWADGGSAWVVDVPLEHGLARPPRSPEAAARYGAEYHSARQRFRAAWQRRFRFRYVGTPNEVLAIGRLMPLVRLLGAPRILRWVMIDRDRAFGTIRASGSAAAPPKVP